MLNIDRFGVIGGDDRQIFMAESIAKDGFNVSVTGFDNIEFDGVVDKNSLRETVRKSKYIILPLPVTKDGKTLNAPYSSQNIMLDRDFAGMLSDKMVFCGMKNKLFETSSIWNLLNIYDYSTNEYFAIKNAVLTAEGAIEIAFREYKGSINGSNCLVTGFGRIGKALSKILYALSANLTVSARNQKDFAYMELMGYRHIKTNDIRLNDDYDIIFNTIPYLVFNEFTLSSIKGNPIIIDLASAPGGIDFEFAKSLGIKAIKAPGLPGKTAPVEAGEIIKKTIYNILEEGLM